MLSQKQIQLAELMVDETELTNVEYAKRVNIDPKTLYTWKKLPAFQAYLKEICNRKFADLEKDAIKQLKIAVKKGNMKAVQYVLDGTGHKATEKVEIADNTIKVKISDDAEN